MRLLLEVFSRNLTSKGFIYVLLGFLNECFLVVFEVFSRVSNCFLAFSMCFLGFLSGFWCFPKLWFWLSFWFTHLSPRDSCRRSERKKVIASRVSQLPLEKPKDSLFHMYPSSGLQGLSPLADRTKVGKGSRQNRSVTLGRELVLRVWLSRTKTFFSGSNHSPNHYLELEKQS